MVRIEKYTLSQLHSFCLAQEYSEMETKPISLIRMHSYCNNPRAKGDDVVLYLAKNNNKLLGFRTILSDTDAQGNTYGWLSGNWVEKHERRKGISSLLLKEVFKDWGNRLMYVNVSPASKAVYDKSGDFMLYASVKGTRFYFRFTLHTLLPNKNRMWIVLKPFLYVFDMLANAALPLFHIFSKQQITDNYKVDYLETFDEESLAFIQKYAKPSLQNRNQNDFKWISTYPWLYKSASDDNYPFSSSFDDYKRYIIKVTDGNGEMQALVMMYSKKACATVPFYFIRNNNDTVAARSIISICKSQKINYLTTYNQELLKHLQAISFVCVLQKSMVRNFFVTLPLLDCLPYVQTIRFQDGDGDCAFV